MSDKDFTPTEPILVDTDAADESKTPATGSPPKLPTPSAPPAPSERPTASESQPHLGVTVDERAYQQYQALAQVVLDSADIASKSAQAAASASRDMNKATSEFKALTEVGHKKALILLGATGGLMLICLIFFLVMGVRMNSRINQLDTMMMAVGKRVVDLNAGLESMDVINRSIEGLSTLQTEQVKAQGLLESRINEALKKSETMVQTVPGETAKQVAASSENLLKQVQGINSRLQSQASAVQNLGNEVKALKGAVGNVDKLNRDVEALVVLQKERYLETLQKNSANTNRERPVQFPRINPPTKPGNESATAAPPPSAPVAR
jgi:DNA repair exonuclease SbcCD ATPase subunit